MVVRRILLVLLCLVCGLSYGQQIVINSNLNEVYFAKIAKDLHQSDFISKLDQLAGQGMLSGEVIMLLSRTDTLNKKDFVKPSVKVQIFDLDANGNKYQALPTSEDDLKLADCNATLNGDTLALHLFSFYPHFLITIARNKVRSIYEEYLKRDTIFRLRLSQPKINQLIIPTKVLSLSLNTDKFKSGQTIYGEMELLTDSL